jgi:hypothetical protein
MFLLALWATVGRDRRVFLVDQDLLHRFASILV